MKIYIYATSNREGQFINLLKVNMHNVMRDDEQVNSDGTYFLEYRDGDDTFQTFYLEKTFIDPHPEKGKSLHVLLVKDEMTRVLNSALKSLKEAYPDAPIEVSTELDGKTSLVLEVMPHDISGTLSLEEGLKPKEYKNANTHQNVPRDIHKNRINKRKK